MCAQLREGAQRRRGCHHVGSPVTINCLARPQWFTAAALHHITYTHLGACAGSEWRGEGARVFGGCIWHVYCYNSIFYSKPHLYLLLYHKSCRIFAFVSNLSSLLDTTVHARSPPPAPGPPLPTSRFARPQLKVNNKLTLVPHTHTHSWYTWCFP